MTSPAATTTGTAATTNAATAAPGVDTAAIVGDIYAAFARGDVPAILERLAEDVAWDAWPSHSAQRAGVAHLQERHGRDGAAGFFAEIAGWTVEDFRVLDVIGNGRQVVAEVEAAFVLPNGGRYADCELHLWTFDEDGLVTRFRHYVDTAKHIAAARGEDTRDGATGPRT